VQGRRDRHGSEPWKETGARWEENTEKKEKKSLPAGNLCSIERNVGMRTFGWNKTENQSGIKAALGEERRGNTETSLKKLYGNH